MKGLALALILLVFPAPAGAEEPAPPAAGADELAKKLANPISDLVSVPFQFNWDQGVGPDEQTRFVLNVQPVIPFRIGENTNMIMRVIVPLVSQPPLVPGGEATGGIGDILASFFFAPHTGGLIWGVGPVFNLPSTAEPTLGSEKWCAGPTFVVLKQAGPWTTGMLWNQIWSFSGNVERADVNQMFVQPFLAYGRNGYTFTLQSESTGNFEVDEDRWTIPVNFVVSKVAHFGTFPASYALGAGKYVEAPDGGPSWKLRAAVTVMLPTRR